MGVTFYAIALPTLTDSSKTEPNHTPILTPELNVRTLTITANPTSNPESNGENSYGKRGNANRSWYFFTADLKRHIWMDESLDMFVCIGGPFGDLLPLTYALMSHA